MSNCNKSKTIAYFPTFLSIKNNYFMPKNANLFIKNIKIIKKKHYFYKKMKKKLFFL